MPDEMENALKQMLSELLTKVGHVDVKQDVMNEKIDTLADLVSRHDISLYGHDDKDGVIGRVGRFEERTNGRFERIESDIKRMYAAGGFVLTVVVGATLAKLLNLI